MLGLNPNRSITVKDYYASTNRVNILFSDSKVNHPPTVSNPIANQNVEPGTAFNFQIPSNTFTDIDAGDVLTDSATLEKGIALPSWLTFNSTTRTFSGTPTKDNVGSLNIQETATDKAGAVVSDIFTLTVQSVNHPPTVSNPIAGQNAKPGTAFNFQIPSNTFTDIDAGDVLTDSATLEKGNPLPTWLSFNPTTSTFSGTPTKDNVGSLNIQVTATDKAGAVVSNIFTLTINDLPSYKNQLTTSIIRFQNKDKPGTYLFAGEQEAASIRQNNKNFKEEGLAFQVAVEKTDPLMQGFYRFRNTDKGREGTYLFAGEQEAASIRQNYKNFVEEGLAFYTYSAGVGGGTTDFARFQNKDLPGTYLFTGPSETSSVLNNYNNFTFEGSAFAAAG